MAKIVCKGLTKRYDGGPPVLHPLDMEIDDGEFVVLLLSEKRLTIGVWILSSKRAVIRVHLKVSLILCGRVAPLFSLVCRLSRSASILLQHNPRKCVWKRCSVTRMCFRVRLH